MFDFTENNIVGIIDNYDCVHSVMVSHDDDQFHSSHFSQQTNRKWRWSWDRSVETNWSITSLTKEDRMMIREHLTKKYDIPFWENGHHDIQYMKKWEID